MGANVRINCPVEGCDFIGGFRLGMGEETSASAWRECANTLLEEHPDHVGGRPVAVDEKTITDV